VKEIKEGGVEEIERKRIVTREYHALDRKRGGKTIEKVTDKEKRMISVEYEMEIIKEEMREK